MASLVTTAASSLAGAASRGKKRPASPGTGPAKKKKATAPGGSQDGVRTTVLNVANKLHLNCEKLLPDMIMFDNFFKGDGELHGKLSNRCAWKSGPAWGKAPRILSKSAGGEAVSENKFLNTDSNTGSVETTAKPLPFKDPNFIHSGIGGAAAGKKNRTWKNLKQILASERALPWQLNDPSYFNIDAPPSFKPAKKYSDISGLPANYTDPQSKLRFSTIEEFAYIRMLPSDVVTGYLALRKATSIVS
ncbi:INO80 complex subunit C [Turdus rufiventris]|nr:INO80 complex subunit C [Turdus rufiventris]